MNQLISWLQKRFFCSKPKLLFQNLSRFLEGKMRETLISQPSNDRSVSVVVQGIFGDLSYDKARGKTGKRILIEQIEFVPKKCGERGFSFTFVNNELSVMRHNGADPSYAPSMTLAEQQTLTAFVEALRQKTEAFLKAKMPKEIA